MILPTTTSRCARLRGVRGWTAGGAWLNTHRQHRVPTPHTNRVESESWLKGQALAGRLGGLA
jgi:hypothetical protein